MALATDHRPDEMEEFAGNEALKASLCSILKRDKEDIPHVILFTGKSGCGKTTLARIFASELDCDPSELYELNAASVRGIDDIRRIEGQVRYRPMTGGARVWVFDEIHQYGTPAQEVMLKMLEEAPDHAYFILCTTDPEKLRPALKGRCTTFTVEALDNEEMVEFLEDICEEEDTEVPEKVLRKIAKNSEGSPRNALQLLEKVIDIPEKEMMKTLEKTEEAETQTFDLYIALLERKPWKDVAAIVRNIKSEPESIRRSILGLASSGLLKKKNDQAALILENFVDNVFDSGMPGVVLACYQSVVE
jgi:DNA polymerase-3 subunit gamma/tau